MARLNTLVTTASFLSLLVARLIFNTLAFPFDPDWSDRNETSLLQVRADDFYLRIMPLGASITYGVPAAADTTGN